MTAKPPAEPRKTAPPQRKSRLRADARRNRDRLVEVAAAAFAEHGVEASLEEIARAGRRRHRHALPAFSDPRASGRGGLSPRSRGAVRGGRRACAPPSARCRAGGMDAALRRLHRRQARHGQQPAHPAHHQFRLFADMSGMVPLALRRLVDAAVADGSIRGDIDSSDVLHALSGIYAAPETPGLARPLPPAGLAAHGRPSLGLLETPRRLNAVTEPADRLSGARMAIRHVRRCRSAVCADLPPAGAFRAAALALASGLLAGHSSCSRRASRLPRPYAWAWRC